MRKVKLIKKKQRLLEQLKNEDNLTEWAVELGRKGKAERIKELKKTRVP